MIRQITAKNRRISTILAFILIPLSGLATDVYIPSFPDMANAFHTSDTNIQRTMVFFLVSYGVSQFFIGSLIDRFGRYRLNLLALLVFTLSNVVIILSRDIHMVYGMRVIQGIATAFIVIGKRSFFVDVYTGEKQKHYTSMLSIVWASAPILAPFLGGFLQKSFGWASNFYLLAIYGAIMFILELIFSGESMKTPQPLHPAAVLNVYRKLITSVDFSAGVLVLGFTYTMVMVFSMSAPFIIEQQFHLSPVVTGYCALFSGVAMFVGGILGKSVKWGSLYNRLVTANILQALIAVGMFAVAAVSASLPVLMIFVVLLHMLGGFSYNLFFTYCLTRFPQNVGTAGGVTSGGSYLITSVCSAAVLGVIAVTGQQTLAISYLIMILAIMVILASFRYKLRFQGKVARA